MGRFIKLVGSKHAHDLPAVVGYGSPISKMHTGSVWECSCGKVFEWDGKSWNK